MKSNFDEFNTDWPFDSDLLPQDEDFERFMLLSAYLDGEVTPQERQQVQQWLDTDPEIKQKYMKLMKIQQTTTHLPMPNGFSAPQPLIESVFQEIDQQNQQRRLLIGSGLVIAALIGAMTSNWVMKPSFMPSISHIEVSPPEVPVSESSDSLMIALNQPIVEIPADIQGDVE